MIAAAIFALGLFAQAGNPIVPPPVPGPSEIHVTNTTVVNVPPMDPQAVQDATVQAGSALIVSVAQPVPVEWANSLCSLPDIWRKTPPELTYGQADIAKLSRAISVVAGVLLGIAIFAQAMGHMFGQPLELGRVIFAEVVNIGILTFWQWGIDLNNALTGAIGAPDLCTSLVKPHIELAHPSATESMAAPILVIVYAAVSLLVLASLIFRIGFINILIAIGGLCALCSATEESSFIWQWYTRMSIGTVFGQVLFVAALEVAHVVSGIGNGAQGALMGIIVLLLSRQMLSTLTHQNHSGGATGMMLLLAARRLITKVF